MTTPKSFPVIPLAVKTVDEVAQMLGLTRAGVYWLIQQGQIAASTVAGKLVISDTELDRVLADRKPKDGGG